MCRLAAPGTTVTAGDTATTTSAHPVSHAAERAGRHARRRRPR